MTTKDSCNHEMTFHIPYRINLIYFFLNFADISHIKIKHNTDCDLVAIVVIDRLSMVLCRSMKFISYMQNFHEFWQTFDFMNQIFFL